MRRYLNSMVLVILLQTGVATRTGAASSPLQAGDRVRVTAPRFEFNPVEGKIAAFDSTRLTLTPAAGPAIALSLHEIGALEVSRGRPHHAGWGALAGAVLLGSVAAYYVAQIDEEDDFPGVDVYPAIYGISGAFLGAGLGALVGWCIRGEERWEPIGIERLRLGITGEPGTPLCSAGVFISF